MKTTKRILTLVLVLGLLGTATFAFADGFKTPAEILSSLTGKSVDTLNEERAQGKTYGAIASENGQLDAFHAEMLKQKKALLGQSVKDGRITQAQADAIIKQMETNQANCNGTGIGMGRMNGMGKGMGRGMGRGFGGYQGCATVTN